MLTIEQGAKLVKLARHAIETMLFSQPLTLLPYKEFSQKSGVYVTLRKNGKLRGQMGAILPKAELFQAVLDSARDAAFHDRRFEPVSKNEIKDIEVEVDVVTNTKLLRVNSADEYIRQIRPQKEGLFIQSGVYSAILFPNPEMALWDSERVLRYLCESAGLTMDAWRDLSQDIYSFSVQRFAETDGKVVELA